MGIIKKVLKDNKGNGHFLTVSIVLLCLLIFSGVFEYMRIVTITRGVRDSLQNACISVATKNLPVAYADLREIDFDEELPIILTNGDIMAELKSDLLLPKNEFTLSNLDTEPVQQYEVSTGTRYIIRASLDITIPLSGNFRLLPPMKKRVNIVAGVTAKF